MIINKLFIYRRILTEIKKSQVISLIGDDLTEKLYNFTSDDAYYHLVINTIKNDEGYTVEDLINPGILEKFKTYVSSAWNTNKKVNVEIAGINIVLDKQKSGYSDFYKFLQIKAGLKASTVILNKIIHTNNTDNEHFDILINDKDWYISYPKTQLGSMALGRSYWDKSENKLKYDTTFNASNGSGINTGEISWCTVADGSSNYFLSYHTNQQLHMFYCISKKFGKEDIRRKLCLSLAKSEGNVYFSDDEHSCVDGDNNPQPEEFFRKCLGSRYDKLVKYTKNNLEEIDYEKYYTEYNLIQYRSQYENPDIDSELCGDDYDADPNADTHLDDILTYTRDTRIFYAALESNMQSEAKIKILLRNKKTPIEIIAAIMNMQKSKQELEHYFFKTRSDTENFNNTLVKTAIFNNPNTPEWVKRDLLKHLDVDTLLHIANTSDNENILKDLEEIDNIEVKKAVANNPNTPEWIKSDLLNYLDVDTLLRIANTSDNASILIKLSRVDNIEVKIAVANNTNTQWYTLSELSRVDNIDIKKAVANNTNTPEWVKSHLLKYLDSDTSLNNIVPRKRISLSGS